MDPNFHFVQGFYVIRNYYYVFLGSTDVEKISADQRITMDEIFSRKFQPSRDTFYWISG